MVARLRKRTAREKKSLETPAVTPGFEEMKIGEYLDELERAKLQQLQERYEASLAAFDKQTADIKKRIVDKMETKIQNILDEKASRTASRIPI